jgi:sterol desaturase/sphingolipid hydroxylase (fatty acid hydroxylase superfamily)
MKQKSRVLPGFSLEQPDESVQAQTYIQRVQRRIPGWISGTLTFGAILILFWQERRRPLRASVESTKARTSRNLVIAGITALALQLTERPLISRLARYITKRNLGLLRKLSLPLWLEIPLAVILMDYTLYWRHVLTHRVPWLWRFHVVHHIDLDLDASTAMRFHFAEMVLSVGWRAGQVALLGVSPLPLSIWQTFLLISVFFHHSNVALPVSIERRLVQFIVTPRMHGIHHSIRREENHSNWSSGLTLWDLLHGTLRLDVPQQEIIIGVPAYRSPQDRSLSHLLLMPFAPQRPAWTPPAYPAP